LFANVGNLEDCIKQPHCKRQVFKPVWYASNTSISSPSKI